MKIPFFNRSPPKEPEPISYRSEFRDFLQKNAPLDFETKMARARPFIFASFIAWPAFWTYRGMDWSNKKLLERSLVSYINRTFHQAKIMQFTILSLGLMFAVHEENHLLQKVNHMLKGIDDGEEYRAMPREVNLGEEVRRLMHRRDIEKIMESASPFLLSAVLAWPTVWLYRGFDWHTKKGKETLPLYIRKTFFQAKAVQFTVLAMGLIYVVGNTTARNI